MCLCLPLTHFPISPPNAIHPPSSSVWVWHHHMQCLHCGPTTFQWIVMCYIIFQCLSPSPKTNKVFFSSSFCTTIGSMVVCSYTNPSMMSGLGNAGDNACPLSYFFITNTALLLPFPIRIRGMLKVNNVNILATLEFKL